MTHTSHRSHHERQQPAQPPYVGIRGYTDRLPICQQSTDTDADGRAYLAMAADDLRGAVHWLGLALKGRDDWQEALGLELDTLRGVLAAIEQEVTVTP